MVTELPAPTESGPSSPALSARPAAEHVVEPRDTLYSISRRYGLTVAEVARLNDLRPPYVLKTGQRLRVSEANASGETAAGLPVAPPGGVPGETLTTDATAALPPADDSPPPPRAGKRFRWPIAGRMVSGFGTKPGGLRNDGINIAAARGTAVSAAENGVVAYAGNELRGFGNLILLRHADGWVTAYAHANEVLVRRGDRVTRGQPIARVGSTGNVASPQLHFEIRRDAQAVDPIAHLDGTAQSEKDGRLAAETPSSVSQ